MSGLEALALGFHRCRFPRLWFASRPRHRPDFLALLPETDNFFLAALASLDDVRLFRVVGGGLWLVAGHVLFGDGFSCHDYPQIRVTEVTFVLLTTA